MITMTLRQVHRLIQAFADETRLRLIGLLADGELCVCDLCAALDVPQPTVSRHLAHLAKCGVVTFRREGKWKHYSLSRPAERLHAALVEGIGCCRSSVDEFTRDRERLAKNRCCGAVFHERKEGPPMLKSETSCCASPHGASESAPSTGIHRAVQDRYGQVAASVPAEDPHAHRVARAFGYTPEELAAVPAGANMGLSCGNPTSFAGLKPGEVVVDLGCGGGLDVFLAAEKVGSKGKAIGIDMTPAMIERAKRHASSWNQGSSPGNVEFHLAKIEELPLPDRSVDVVVSNCVINLSPDKRAVFREAARVLRPGGRIAVSDIVLRKPLPPEIARDIGAYTGCIAGAITMEEYRRGLVEAGFAEVVFADTGADLNAYQKDPGSGGSCCSGESGTRNEPGCGSRAGFDANEFVASVRIFAVKPED
jgi:arsenite methyltransferase